MLRQDSQPREELSKLKNKYSNNARKMHKYSNLNRRASDYLQDDQRDRQTRADSSSSECVTVFVMYIVDARTGDPSSQHIGTSPSPTRDSIKRRASVRGSHLFFTMFTRGRIGKRCVSTNLFTRAWWLRRVETRFCLTRVCSRSWRDRSRRTRSGMLGRLSLRTTIPIMWMWPR